MSCMHAARTVPVPFYWLYGGLLPSLSNFATKQGLAVKGKMDLLQTKLNIEPHGKMLVFEENYKS